MKNHHAIVFRINELLPSVYIKGNILLLRYLLLFFMLIAVTLTEACMLH